LFAITKEEKKLSAHEELNLYKFMESFIALPKDIFTLTNCDNLKNLQHPL